MELDEGVRARFDAKHRPAGAGCWEWTGALSGPIKDDGRRTYGSIWVKSLGQKAQAHRVAYALFVEPIPEGMEIDHLCKNTRCVNPWHLEAVTGDENSRRERQAVCKNGHDLTLPENQRFDKQGRRRGCRQCKADKMAEWTRANRRKRSCSCPNGRCSLCRAASSSSLKE